MCREDKMMIDAQAALITKLNGQIRSLQQELNKEIGETRALQTAGVFYLQMQRDILANPILQGEWTRFCSFLRMSIPDIEEE
jgi:hypothetical protein